MIVYIRILIFFIFKKCIPKKIFYRKRSPSTQCNEKKLEKIPDCSIDSFSIASIGKLNWKFELLPRLVAKDFFTKWPLFADILCSLAVLAMNWIDVFPMRIC